MILGNGECDASNVTGKDVRTEHEVDFISLAAAILQLAYQVHG